MKRLPPLSALRVFEAAARTGSFTLAANELSVTTGAVSRQIKLLETYLGVNLFARYHRRIELTVAGIQYAASVRKVFDTLVQAEQALGQSEKDVIRVDCIPTLAMYWLTPQLDELHRHVPNALVTLSTSLGPVSPAGTFDVAIRRDIRHFSGLRSQKLMPEWSLPVCSQEFAERHRITSLERMLRCPTIHVRAREDLWPVWSNHFRLAAPTTAKRLELDHTFAAIQAAEDGMGLVVVPFLFAKRMIDSGRLVAPFPDMLVETGGYYLLRRDETRSDLVEKVCKWLAKRAKSQ